MVQQQEARNQSKQAVQKAIFDLGSLPSLNSVLVLQAIVAVNTVNVISFFIVS